MTGNLLTTAEVAERLGVSSWAVAQAVRAGALEPSARTNDDFLFTERAVAAFAEQKAEAAATPLQTPPAASRAEWAGDVDRLNAWLNDLNESAPVGARPTDTIAMPMPMPLPAAPPEPAPTPPPALAPAPVPVVGRTILERIAAGQPAAAPPAMAGRQAAEPVPAAVQPEPEPRAAAPDALMPATWPEPAAAEEPSEVLPAAPAEPDLVVAIEPDPVVASEPDPVVASVPDPVVASVPDPVVASVPDPVPPRAEPQPTPGVDLSRQALLVVQPIVRFRVLRDVAERLATIRGIADARLERLEGGVASYRVSFEGERPSGGAIGQALAALNLEVILVDSHL